MEPGVELWWMSVGAGTSRVQQASLRLWEAIEAARARRPRARLVHSALKLHDGTATWTLELTPAFVAAATPPLITGPVGLGAAGRLRLFRYQLVCLPGETFPDEAWAVAQARLPGEAELAARLLALAPTVPRHVWGRRVHGTREMWTSDSVVSWLLARAGVDVPAVAPPAGTRAPGWGAGLALARRRVRPSMPGTVPLDP